MPKIIFSLSEEKCREHLKTEFGTSLHAKKFLEVVMYIYHQGYTSKTGRSRKHVKKQH